MTIKSIGFEVRKQLEGVKFDDHDSFVHHLEKVKEAAKSRPIKLKLMQDLKFKRSFNSVPSSLNLTKTFIPPSSNISQSRY